MKTIIVPTDFSSASVNAAHYAARLAKHVQAELVLLHVLPMPITIADVPIPADSIQITIDETNQSLKELKEELEASTNHKLSIRYRATTDSFLEEVARANDQDNIFAVIMGTSGAGTTEAFFLGSFSLTAAKNLKQPLIVVPPGYTFSGIQKIGLACDMQHVSETVPFRGIRDIFNYFDASLEVLYVAKPDEHMYPQVLAETKFVQNNLAALHPEIRITTNEDIGEGLEDFVQKSHIDLLILVPKERTFIERIFHKSITRKMALHTHIPVAILH